LFDEVGRDGLVDGDLVLLLVGVAGPEDLVDAVAVVGEEDQPFALPVEAADADTSADADSPYPDEPDEE